MTSDFRAGTWNIHEGIPANGSGTEPGRALVTMLIEADVDLVALQEIPFGKTGESPVLEMIATQTHLEYVSGFSLSQSSFHPGHCSGIAVASRFPHSVEQRIRLPNPGLNVIRNQQQWKTWDKGLITIKIDSYREPLWMSSVHGYPFHDFGRHAGEEEFAPVWLRLADAISLIPGIAIVAGDFNTDRRNLVTGLLNRPRLVPSFEGTATHGDKSVDDILHDIRLIRHRSRVTSNFSDHAFCQADFSFRRD